MAIISCNDLKKTFVTGDIKVQALNGVSLSIDKGEMVSVMGPSGCGKTTLLNCLSGIDEPTSGNIMIDGNEITKMDDDEKTDFRAAKMGFVFQFYNLLPVLTASENVELPLLLIGKAPAEAHRRSLDALKQVGLEDRGKQRPASLSGGERQRVTIARALVNRPAIVWADEPTGDLDMKTSESIIALMRKLNKENGQTFVVVTHDPNVGARCDRIIHMRDGVIISEHEEIKEIREEMKKDEESHHN